MSTEKVEKGKAVKPADEVVQPVADYIPGNTDWTGELAQADHVAGHDLAKDELMDALVGVPLLITALTFREGVKRTDGVPSAYVSCEAVIAPEKELKRRRIDLDTLPFSPEDQIIFNDGSTGLYRQIVAYLEAREYITLNSELPEAGGYGESRYDVSPVEFQSIKAGELRYRDDGNWSYQINVRLFAPRGLRISTYTNDYNPHGSKTRYLG
jgi:hypothetical protein